MNARLPYTGGPRYMREIGTPKIGSHIMNLHIKRPRNTINWRIGSGKKAIFQSHIRKIADKKTAYNEGRLYCIMFVTLELFLTIIIIFILLLVQARTYDRPTTIDRDKTLCKKETCYIAKSFNNSAL